MKINYRVRSVVRCLTLTAGLGWVLSSGTAGAAGTDPDAICLDDHAPAQVRLAAREIRRYVYLRTGELLSIGASATGRTIRLAVDQHLAPEEYRLQREGDNQVITGGSALGVLYGSYRYAELLGVRFYLHGDVIPDEPLKAWPAVEDAGRPLFETRGIQPFHDFPEGPDWWNQDDYLAYVAQLAKLRLNFIGLHCYPEGKVGPEPLVWIGPTNDLDAAGQVYSSYPAQWANTERDRMWGYLPQKTSDFAGGAGQLFAADAYGPEVMTGLLPNAATPEQSNELFNRTGRQLGTVFAAAKQLGIKTCIGTETPLTIPQAVRAHSTDVRALYTGMFKHIAAVCPVDYYWLWTPEEWTWSGNQPAQFDATRQDIQAALDALADLGHPFTLATCGWVLGPAANRAALDEFLPKNCPMSCINREVGHAGVEPAFANITGRAKWAIPWMENDPDLVAPQPWVARIRYDAVDARRFGCTGLLGIHWRTKGIAMNIAALAAAAWDQSWVPAGTDTRPVPPSRPTEGALGGKVADFTAPVANTTVPEVYQHVRYDLDGYDLSIPNGTYTVTLQFNEPYYHAATRRVFGVKLQGKPVLEHLDIFARAGQNQALDLSFTNQTVTDGTLRLRFTREVEFPCLAGIVITGKTRPMNQVPSEPFTRQINCGGGRVAGYEADLTGTGLATAAPRQRAMPAEDFYVDFACANFGPVVAEPAGRLLARIDGVHLPEPSTWKQGPGGLVPNRVPWSTVRTNYAFVAELAALREQVAGPGNRERFDYWLNTYQAMAAMAEAGCLRGQLDQALAGTNYQQALATRIELANCWTRLLTEETALAGTPGELGTIANLEQHTRGQLQLIEGRDAELTKALGRPLPPEVEPGKAYTGPDRIIVLTVRGLANRGETLRLKIIALASKPMSAVVVHLRPLGQGAWQTLTARPVARATYAVQLPPVQGDFEYYITAGDTLVWPATAPELNQTVCVFDP